MRGRWKRHTKEQMFKVLGEIEPGASIESEAKAHGIADQTIFRLRQKYTGTTKSDLSMLRALHARCVATTTRLIYRLCTNRYCLASEKDPFVGTQFDYVFAVDSIVRLQLDSRSVTRGGFTSYEPRSFARTYHAFALPPSPLLSASCASNVAPIA